MSANLPTLLLDFHQWARASGTAIGTTTMPSVSYAFDMILVARSEAEIQALISAYLVVRATGCGGHQNIALLGWARKRQLQVDSLMVETSGCPLVGGGPGCRGGGDSTVPGEAAGSLPAGNHLVELWTARSSQTELGVWVLGPVT